MKRNSEKGHQIHHWLDCFTEFSYFVAFPPFPQNEASRLRKFWVLFCCREMSSLPLIIGCFWAFFWKAHKHFVWATKIGNFTGEEMCECLDVFLISRSYFAQMVVKNISGEKLNRASDAHIFVRKRVNLEDISCRRFCSPHFRNHGTGCDHVSDFSMQWWTFKKDILGTQEPKLRKKIKNDFKLESFSEVNRPTASHLYLSDWSMSQQTPPKNRPKSAKNQFTCLRFLEWFKTFPLLFYQFMTEFQTFVLVVQIFTFCKKNKKNRN
jgi:hypothetical protein